MRIIEKASSSFESAQVIVARKAQSCNNSTIQCLPLFFIFLSFGRNVFLVVQEFPYSTLSFVLSAFLVDNLQILHLLPLITWIFFFHSLSSPSNVIGEPLAFRFLCHPGPGFLLSICLQWWLHKNPLVPIAITLFLHVTLSILPLLQFLHPSEEFFPSEILLSSNDNVGPCHQEMSWDVIPSSFSCVIGLYYHKGNIINLFAS